MPVIIFEIGLVIHSGKGKDFRYSLVKNCEFLFPYSIHPKMLSNVLASL
jgi:hypothetical protein